MRVALDGVSVDVAGRSLVRELRLAADSGEVVGLVGPNGSGKSTALRCVYRALRPTAGAVLLDGTDVRVLSLRENATRVAALTQEASSDLDFTVAEVVATGRTPRLHGNRALDARERALCERAMARVDVLHLADRSVLTLSGGERQRVFVARALAQEPQVLVFDEPTNHLDPRHQVEVLSLLRSCGLTVLVALHDLNLAAMTCDRLGVLAGGELVATGTPAEVLTPELVLDVFELPVTVVPHPATRHAVDRRRGRSAVAVPRRLRERRRARHRRTQQGGRHRRDLRCRGAREKLIADIERRAEALRKTHPDGEPARVFLYDSGTAQPFTSGRRGAPNEIIEQAGGRSVTSDEDARWTEVGWESVVQSRPEVIVVVDYGDQPVEQKIEFLKSHRGLASSPAVKNDRFHVMDYGKAVTGPRNIDSAEKLGRYLRSIGR